jgi:hypothetical protein
VVPFPAHEASLYENGPGSIPMPSRQSGSAFRVCLDQDAGPALFVDEAPCVGEVLPVPSSKLYAPAVPLADQLEDFFDDPVFTGLGRHIVPELPEVGALRVRSIGSPKLEPWHRLIVLSGTEAFR